MKRTELRTIAEQINKALAAIAKEHGMNSLKIAGKIRFEGSDEEVTAFKVTVEAIVNDAKGKNDLQALGFPPDTIGKEVTIAGTPYRITGANLNRTKFGVQAINLRTNKPCSFDTMQLLRILENQKPNLKLTNR